MVHLLLNMRRRASAHEIIQGAGRSTPIQHSAGDEAHDRARLRPRRAGIIWSGTSIPASRLSCAERGRGRRKETTKEKESELEGETEPEPEREEEMCIWFQGLRFSPHLIFIWNRNLANVACIALNQNYLLMEASK